MVKLFFIILIKIDYNKEKEKIFKEIIKNQLIEKIVKELKEKIVNEIQINKDFIEKEKETEKEKKIETISIENHFLEKEFNTGCPEKMRLFLYLSSNYFFLLANKIK